MFLSYKMSPLPIPWKQLFNDFALNISEFEDKAGNFRPEMATGGNFTGAVNQFELNTLCNIGL